ncbi:MAG TPA: tetratricopeptide repeat protein, partial [Syntrophales bacterium]|nr:tetratricopeptide repeat protein [Syntrophales bacterium]
METDFLRKKKPSDSKHYQRLFLIVGAVLGAAVLLVGLMWGLAAIFPKHFNDLSSGWIRVKNFVAFAALGKQPQFYYLNIEKNGRVYRVTPREYFEVTYKDEFIITGVATDDLRGKGITVDIDGTGRRNDFQVLMKGIEFVDRVMKHATPGKYQLAGGEYRIHVRYLDREIGSIPMKILILPQDWLRQAQGSANERQQIDALKRAVAANPDDTGLRKVLAGIYFRQGAYRAAINEYERVLRLNPQDGGALKELARCHLSQKDYGEAVKVFQRLLAIQPNDPSIYTSLGGTYAAMGSWSKAAASYQQALRLNKEDGNVHFLLGKAYEAGNKLTEAIGSYQAALNRNPTDDDIVAALANANLKAGNNDEAIKWYRELLKRQPRNATAYANIGLAYGNKKLPGKEMESYRKALSLNPKDPVVQFNLAAALEKSGKAQEAAKYYR